MVASHNQRSVQLAIDEMKRLGIKSGSMDGTDESNGGVYFGQLLGMADQISFSLGSQGYSVYKYVPYGKLEEVIPYLMRRAQENSSVAGAAGDQASLIAGILRRRLIGF
jgi:proline dehydrogenase